MTEADQERVALIRRGNELFNQGDIKNALKIYLATNYIDGIIRVGDYYYFDKNDKVTGVKLYKKAGHQKVIDDFAEKAAATIKLWLEEDKKAEAVIPEEEIAELAPDMKPKEWKPIELSVEDIVNFDKNKKK